MTALLTINLIVLALAAWFSITKVVPACATSRYRYRLWRLRDALSDDIRHGKFHDEEAAKKVRLLIDLAIEDADDLSALNLVLFQLVLRRSDLPADPLGLEELSPYDQECLKERLEEVQAALLSKTLFGSVSGWLATFFLIPVVVVAAFRDSGQPRVLQRTSNRIRDDLVRSNRLDGPHGHTYQHVG